MTKFISKTVDIVFLAFLSVVVLAMGVTLTQAVLDGWLAFVSGVILVLCVFLGLFFLRDQIKTIAKKIYVLLTEINVTKMMLIIGIFSVVTKVFFVFLPCRSKNILFLK